LILIAIFFLFGGCGRGFFWRGGGCGRGWYGPDAGPGSGPAPEPETPKQILDKRLARGEITPEEYRQLLADLGGR
jgi:hypothetical protein